MDTKNEKTNYKTQCAALRHELTETKEILASIRIELEETEHALKFTENEINDFDKDLAEANRKIAVLQKDLDLKNEILDNLPAMVYVGREVDLSSDIHNTFGYANQPLFDITGLSCMNPITDGDGFLESIIHPDDLKSIMETRQQSCKAGSGSALWSGCRIKTAGGEYSATIGKCVAFRPKPAGAVGQFIHMAILLPEDKPTAKMLKELHITFNLLKNRKILRQLTEIEKKIIRLICAGFTYKEIAERTPLKKEGVDSAKDRILVKLNLSNVNQLITFAVDNGLD